MIQRGGGGGRHRHLHHSMKEHYCSYEEEI